MKTYEQRYKEALERARTWKEKSGMPKDKQGILDDIFPELKESEDENIRKTLINFLDNIWYLGKNADFDNYSKADCAGWIAWLEKQGKSAHGTTKEESIDKTNKVEPKFKVGDWIISNDTKMLRYIVEVNNFGYTTDCGYCSYDYYDNNFRHWSIEDAKDGDVLSTKDTVFIFKCMDKIGLSLCKSYCEVIGNSKLGLGFDFPINGVHPATKEQCNFLFQKMEEAGYEWNAEKKELKKIEQKPAWNEEDETMFACLLGTLTWTTNNNYHCSEDIPKYMRWLENLKQRLNGYKQQ